MIVKSRSGLLTLLDDKWGDKEEEGEEEEEEEEEGRASVRQTRKRREAQKGFLPNSNNNTMPLR